MAVPLPPPCPRQSNPAGVRRHLPGTEARQLHKDRSLPAGSSTRSSCIGETLTMVTAIERARQSFERQIWGDAHTRLSAADEEAPLEPEDLERLAVAAYLIGKDADSAAVWERAHQSA